jgi:hypothetical protein
VRRGSNPPEPRTRLAPLAEPTGSFFITAGSRESESSLAAQYSVPRTPCSMLPASYVVSLRKHQSPNRGESCDAANSNRA